MSDIIMYYMLAMMMLSGILTYLWCKKHQFSSTISFVCSVILLCSSLFFQAHRQIMFVNYLPFLWMALLAIDYDIKKRKCAGMIVSVVLIIFHSYYFSISAIVVCAIYYIYQLHEVNGMGWKAMVKPMMRFTLAIGVSIAIACVLLLPTALVLLGQHKDVASVSLNEIIGLNLDMKGLLYNTYGCGFTMVAYLALMVGMFQKKTKYLSMTLFVCFLFPFVSYVLNGTLYARTKIMMPFIPLIIVLVACLLQRIIKKEVRYHVGMIPLLLLPVLFIRDHNLYVIVDLVVTLFILFGVQRYHSRFVLLLCIVPFLYGIVANSNDTYLNQSRSEAVLDTSKKQLLTSNEIVGRSDDLSDPLANSNRVYAMNQYKTSVYTSTTNTLYNAFYFDIMNNPISIVNRVAQPTKPNPFFQHHMGVRQLISKKQVPLGYEVVDQVGAYKLLQNRDVLPIAYVNEQTMSETKFDTLSYPNTMDTIVHNTIVKGKGNSTYQSQMQKRTLRYDVVNKSDNISIVKDEDSYKIKARKKARITLDLHDDLDNQIVLIRFQVRDVAQKETRNTSIKINGVLNKLSKESAHYPNHNTTFTYVLSNQGEIKQLVIEFSKGEYTIDQLLVHTLDYNNVKQRTSLVTPLIMKKTKHKEVLKGSIQTDHPSYFVTTLPYMSGYRAYVDGQEVNVELVNKAFVGFKLAQGRHDIKIIFEAPGKKVGMLLSFVGLILLLWIWIFERRVKHGI